MTVLGVALLMNLDTTVFCVAGLVESDCGHRAVHTIVSDGTHSVSVDRIADNQFDVALGIDVTNAFRHVLRMVADMMATASVIDLDFLRSQVFDRTIDQCLCYLIDEFGPDISLRYAEVNNTIDPLTLTNWVY